MMPSKPLWTSRAWTRPRTITWPGTATWKWVPTAGPGAPPWLPPSSGFRPPRAGPIPRKNSPTSPPPPVAREPTPHPRDTTSVFPPPWDGRNPASGLENSHLSLSLADYHKLTPYQILAGFVSYDVARKPDPETWYYIGGDQGLRGFPNQLHPGDARWGASFDYRLLTE